MRLGNGKNIFVSLHYKKREVVMIKKLEGTKTLQNLVNSFAGESQARERYTIYSKIAKKEGYEQIAQVFLDTAENEMEHGKLFFEKINGLSSAKVDAAYPFELGNTIENINSAMRGEAEEHDVLYLKGEEDAKEEGFDEIALLFAHIRTVEKHHSERYAELLESLQEKITFTRNHETEWQCRKCGYIVKSKSAPQKCPLCSHPQAYFQQLCEKY